jgi:hypothetical protein
LYDFVWNGTDKVKRRTLIGSYAQGGLNMPDIEIAILSQRVMCIKKYLDNSHRTWKTFLNCYLKDAGGSFLFRCNFDPGKLHFKLPKFYEECVKAWFAVNNQHAPESNEDIRKQIIWNNRFICINNCSVFDASIFRQGIYKIEDLYDFSGNLNSAILGKLSPIERLKINGILSSIPSFRRTSIKNHKSVVPDRIICLNQPVPEQIFLPIEGNLIPLDKVSSKQVYTTLIANRVSPPCTKFFYENNFNESIDWKFVFTLPAKSCLDTKTREFQFKILHRIVFTKKLLFKIGKTASPLCSFCSKYDETIEHLFLDCEKVLIFWVDLFHFLNNYSIQVENMSEMDILLGCKNRNDDTMLINHILLLAKYYIYKCSLSRSQLFVSAFQYKIKQTFDLEFRISNKNDKLQIHYKKWNKLLAFLY